MEEKNYQELAEEYTDSWFDWDEEVDNEYNWQDEYWDLRVY